MALRLALQLGEDIGEIVGYKIRGESRGSKATRLEVVTEALLIRNMQQQPELNDIALIILDQCHKHSLQADLSLALLLDIQQSLRPDLKLLLMSATLDNHTLANLLPESVAIKASGKSFRVTRQAIYTLTRTSLFCISSGPRSNGYFTATSGIPFIVFAKRERNPFSTGGISGRLPCRQGSVSSIR